MTLNFTHWLLIQLSVKVEGFLYFIYRIDNITLLLVMAT